MWAIGLMERWFYIWDDLANPKNGLNLLCKSKGSTRMLAVIEPKKQIKR